MDVIENQITIRSWRKSSDARIPELIDGYAISQLDEDDLTYRMDDVLGDIEDVIRPVKIGDVELKFHHFLIRRNGGYLCISLLEDFGANRKNEMNFYGLYEALRKIGRLP